MTTPSHDAPRTLPPDGHTHTQWSWDADSGSMEGSCARAVQLGLPAIAFTEHVDAVRFAEPRPTRSRMDEGARPADDDGRFVPPPLDVDGYLACVARCRDRFPELRILTGAELGEPHWFPDRGAALRATGAFERLLGSLHHIRIDGVAWAVDDLFGPDGPEDLHPNDVVRLYLAEIHDLVTTADEFAVLAHLDYPLRHWPAELGPFAINDHEEAFRSVLRALAASGRALEVNTVVPLDSEVVRWWAESGGDAVTFGSDAHEPSSVGRGLPEAAAMVEAHGFRPGNHAHDVWRR